MKFIAIYVLLVLILLSPGQRGHYSTQQVEEVRRFTSLVSPDFRLEFKNAYMEWLYVAMDKPMYMNNIIHSGPGEELERLVSMYNQNSQEFMPPLIEEMMEFLQVVPVYERLFGRDYSCTRTETAWNAVNSWLGSKGLTREDL